MEISSKHIHSQIVRARESPNMCHTSHFTFHVPHVTCHISRLTCHVSHVTCHIISLSSSSLSSQAGGLIFRESSWLEVSRRPSGRCTVQCCTPHLPGWFLVAMPHLLQNLPAGGGMATAAGATSQGCLGHIAWLCYYFDA